MARVIRGLRDRRMRHSVVCLTGEPVIRDQIPANVPVYCLHARPNELVLPWRLLRLIRRARPTVIHARNWSAWPDIAIARLGLWPPVPLIFSFHGFAQPDRIPLRRRLAFRALSRITTHLFTVSEASRRMLVDKMGWPAHRVLLVPNGVDTDHFTPAPARPRPSERLVVGTVGSLTPVKNHALLVRACAELAASGVPCEVRIAGEGPERSRLEDLARSLGVPDRICLKGHVTDVPQFLRQLDVFVLPSRSEAHPNALIEAMACGLPCVATHVGGVGEVLDEGRCGLVVEPDNTTALARSLAGLAANPAAREALGRAARQRVCARYSLPAMIGAYDDLYRRASRGRLGLSSQHGKERPACRPSVLMLGPLPPLKGGMATVTANLRGSSLRRQCRLAVLNNGKMTSPGRSFLAGLTAQVRLLARVLGLIRRRRVRILHIQTCALFTFWRDCFHVAAARALGCRVILHVHDGSFEGFVREQRLLRRAILRWALRASAAVILLSRMARDALAPLVPDVPWRVVSNGVWIPPETGRRPDGPMTFLFLGNLTHRKGAYDLLAATRLAMDKGFSGVVHLAGGETAPGQIEAFNQQVREDGCDGHVRSVGFLTGRAKDEAIASAQCLVLPSYAEGLPMAILEAMAYGLPVIATRVGAVAEAVTDGREGFLIEPGDVEALADRMMQLAGNPDLRRRMGDAARRRAEKEFSLDAAVDRIAAIYDDALGQRHESHETNPAAKT